MTTRIQGELHLHPAHERGIQDPVRTLKLGSGTCRDFAVLMMEAVRSLGPRRAFRLRLHLRPGPRRGGARRAAAPPTPGAGLPARRRLGGIRSHQRHRRQPRPDPRGDRARPGQAVPLSGTWTGFRLRQPRHDGRRQRRQRARSPPTRGAPPRVVAALTPGNEQNAPHADPRRLRNRLRLPAADADAAGAERPSLARAGPVDAAPDRPSTRRSAPATTATASATSAPASWLRPGG